MLHFHVFSEFILKFLCSPCGCLLDTAQSETEKEEAVGMRSEDKGNCSHTNGIKSSTPGPGPMNQIWLHPHLWQRGPRRVAGPQRAALLRGLGAS